MIDKSIMQERVREILELKGRKVLDEARKAMLEDSESEDLRAPLQHLAENWKDLFRPALIALSCEAVDGKSARTISAATAMTLLCSSMSVYDNIMDRSKHKRFVPTLLGKFGNGIALIVGGRVTAKAFRVLYEQAKEEIPPSKRDIVYGFFHDFLSKMSKAEVANLKLRRQVGNFRKRFRVIKMQAADLEACMKIGAAIGCGSEKEIEQLGRYGLLLGTAVKLRKDFMDAFNLTVELADNIRSGALPYLLIWSINHSESARNLLSKLKRKKKIEPSDIKRIAEIILESGAVNHCKSLSEKLVNAATKALKDLRESEAKHSLQLLASAQLSLPTHNKFLA